MKEPNGLILANGKRPDGVTIIPWARGKSLAWDATIPDTLAASHLHQTSNIAGAAAEQASLSKLEKYAALSESHIFVPVAIETLGAWNTAGLKFVNELGRRTTAITGEPRETVFLRQRISAAIQRGNAAAFIGSLPNKQSDVDCC
jgi:hypothetical protein